MVTLWVLFCCQSLSQDKTGETASEKSRFERGAEIYKTMCASCHGQNGQGVSDVYADPLIGDASLGELSKLIHDTMPDGEPEKCVGADAEAVAAFVYEQFYGPAAQVRNRPARIGLARLTGNQLRQSLSDLYAHFGGVAERTDKRGVKGSYFEGDRFKKENLKVDRIDPV
ncbi:MAG: cytochrome c, partial [Pirellula sp.]